MGTGETLIAVASVVLLVGGPIFLVYLILHFGNKNKTKKMDTLLKIVELGGDVNPDLMAMLETQDESTSDLRKGLIWLAIGVPLTLAMTFSGGLENWTSGLFGLIPVFIGASYLIVLKYGHKADK